MGDASLLDEPDVIRVTTGAPSGLVDALREAAGDRHRVAIVGPTGASGLEPLVTVTRAGATAFFAAPAPDRAAAAVDDPRAAGADAVVEHGGSPTGLPAPPLGPLAVGTRAVLGRCGWVRPADPADHRATGGFRTIEADPDAALDAVGGLRGRGWGDVATDVPATDAWERVRAGSGEPAVVVNAHGTPADRLLLESAPLAVLEGAVVAGRVVGAGEIVVYVAAADERAVDAATRAIDALPATDAAVRVVAGPDDYRAGEVTMALEAVEGNHRIEARRRPPGPETYGLDGRPTLVHTPRTLAQVARLVARDGADPTRLVTVEGDVAAPATVELPAGATLRAAVDAVDPTGEFKAACVGGRFGGLTRDLDVPAAPDALATADLGTEGIVEVLAADRCAVAFAGERARFAETENCGRCVPCREGSKQLTALLRGVYDGRHRPDALRELGRVIADTSLCEFGRHAPRPAMTALAAFPDEFEAHAAGRCPTGACERAGPPEVPP